LDYNSDPTLDISSEDAEDELSSDELSSDEELVTDETDINDPDIHQIMREVFGNVIIICLNIVHHSQNSKKVWCPQLVY